MMQSNHLSDDMIQVQRQLLAQRLLRAKDFPELHPTHNLHLLRTGNSSRHRSIAAQRTSSPPQVSPKQFVIKPPNRSAFGNMLQRDDDDHSMATATITTYQDAQQPLHLSTFKPAAGCISAPEYLVRAFVARLRAGVTVIKHGRNRFTKSALYTLKLENGETLTWLAANVDPDAQKKFTSNSRSKRLKLSECREVRLAMSPDPENPAYAGSATLREKCNAFDAHKSFCLVCEHRTLDITAMSDDQARLLVEGFSALCYHLHLQKNAEKQHNAQYHTDQHEITRSCMHFGSRYS